MLSGRFIEILNVSLTNSEKFLVPYVRVCFGQNEQIVYLFFGAQFLFTLLYKNCPQVNCCLFTSMLAKMEVNFFSGVRKKCKCHIDRCGC